jgi:hypothetical protein
MAWCLVRHRNNFIIDWITMLKATEYRAENVELQQVLRLQKPRTDDLPLLSDSLKTLNVTLQHRGTRWNNMEVTPAFTTHYVIRRTWSPIFCSSSTVTTTGGHCFHDKLRLVSFLLILFLFLAFFSPFLVPFLPLSYFPLFYSLFILHDLLVHILRN